jgi:sulfur relay (sulfurtransferase) complex TusBCD TusD component (DsrE family)
MSKSLKKRGRPAGIRASQLALQQKLFEHPDNNKVIEAVYRAALDDEHRNQDAAQKLLMDRMLPISVCDKAADVRQAVKITINSVPTPDRDEKVIN